MKGICLENISKEHKRLLSYKYKFCDCLSAYREGHSSMILEVAEDLDTKPDLVIASVGGGGLFIGVCQGKPFNT